MIHNKRLVDTNENKFIAEELLTKESNTTITEEIHEHELSLHKKGEAQGWLGLGLKEIIFGKINETKFQKLNLICFMRVTSRLGW
jgi:hypothetical protein